MFGCRSLRQIRLPPNLPAIGQEAFGGCVSVRVRDRAAAPAVPIQATGRKIFYSTEMGGQVFNPDVCNSAREGNDISPTWESILYEVDVGAKYAHMAGPGYHNDFDMLEVGNGRLTPDENKAHFALWCLMSSPLLAGNNLTAASKDVVSILTAPGPLSVNQDALGLQGAMCSNGSSS